jgi:Predicted periplasmic or secreted lipoprotein
MNIKLLTLIAVGTLSALAFNACETTSNSNANMRNANANTAVVVNTNSNSYSNSNMSSNANKWNSNISREDYEKNKSQYESERGSSTIGQGADDMWLWVKTRASLLGTSDLRESTINVDVVNSVVTLKGTVASAAQKAKAVEVAKAISGVKSVTDQLKVQPSDSMSNQAVNGNTHSNTNRK